MSESENAQLPRTKRVGDRVVACDRPVGSDPEIIDMILDLAHGVSTKNPGRTQSRSKTLRLGTRASALALWQAEHVRERLLRNGERCEIVPFSTTGDRDLGVPIEDLISDSPFTDDIDKALLNGEIDLAVHSLKDLPIDLPDGLTIAAVLPRGSVTESLVSHGGRKLAELPSGATVGTSSPRRRAQLLALRSDLKTVPLRGPVDERIRRVESGDLDAAILATAGLERLERLDAEAERFTVEQFMPAPGQGALAIVTRRDTESIRRMVAPLNDRAAFLATRAELEFLRPWERSRIMAVAAYAIVERDIVELHGRLLTHQGDVLEEIVERGHDLVMVARNAIRRLSKYTAPMFAEIGL